MRSDSDIKRDLENELRWDPDLGSKDIALSVKSGVVTLAGFVRSYSQKLKAEADMKRIAGVAGVANDIELRLPDIDQRPDADIARDAVVELKVQLPYGWEGIKVLVHNGRVTLEGQVEWHYQRERAEQAVRRIKGVKGVTDLIQLKPLATPSEVKRKIETDAELFYGALTFHSRLECLPVSSFVVAYRLTEQLCGLAGG
jgi:osmotically-inducible protein OsmY